MSRVRVIKTRPPFNHAKHIALSGKTLLVWFVTGYPVAYLWHRFGPTKSVSYQSTEGFHQRPFRSDRYTYVDQYGRFWLWDVDLGWYQPDTYQGRR